MKKNTTQKSLQCWADWIMRIAMAFIFIPAGYDKLFIVTPEKFAAALNMPVILAWCATLGELGAGIGIIAGGLMKNKTGDLITRLSGGMIAFIMVVAFFMVKIKGYDTDFFKGLQGSGDVIALFAMGMYYTLNKTPSRA